MAEVMKHVGKVGEKPVVVVFREVPNEPDNALIVETGTLEPDQHDALMNDPATLETDPALAAEQSAPVSSDDPLEVAKGILQQAMLMEEDVKAMQRDIDLKKAEAYNMAPELQPKKGPGRPKKLV